MSDPRRDRGAQGETCAAAWLEDQGWRVVSRNWRVRLGEIDLIAQRGDTIAFVEVRSTSGRYLSDPLESIDARKRAKLRRLIEHWLALHPEHGREAIFLAVGVRHGPGGATIDRVEEDDLEGEA